MIIPRTITGRTVCRPTGSLDKSQCPTCSELHASKSYVLTIDIWIGFYEFVQRGFPRHSLRIIHNILYNNTTLAFYIVNLFWLEIAQVFEINLGDVLIVTDNTSKKLSRFNQAKNCSQTALF